MEPLKGLTSSQAEQLQKQYGRNELAAPKKQSPIMKILSILKEPMFLLLIVASVIYFFLGEPRDGAIMLIFVVAMISIDAFQEMKTDKTLNALKDLSAPTATVIRDGVEKQVPSADLVPGDLMLVSEGAKISADGKVMKFSDLCVDESSLTGESEGVWKTTWTDKPSNRDEYWRKDYCYGGTLVTQGSGTILIDKIGRETEFGKIGAHIAEAPKRSTPLELQMKKVVKVSAIIALISCLFTAILTWINIPDHNFTDRLTESILSGITLAMAMIPEEFPVIQTVFLSMGAWRLAKKQSLIRRLPSVETLGAISVLCVDKTGTITQNRMSVREAWSPSNDKEQLDEIMGLACETEAYDPMEQAMLRYYEEQGRPVDHLFSKTDSNFVSEYAFSNETKMMGHVWVHEGRLVIAAKGSSESILSICNMSKEERQDADAHVIAMSKQGLRVIAIGFQYPASEKEVPATLEGCRLAFAGLIGLADPPREGVAEDIALCQKAGVRVVMITGDNGVTASAIAGQVGILHNDQVCTGAQLNEMSDDQLRERVKTTNIFSRVLPEHKMRIVKAFKENGAIVAMTGDGVNDAPALKYADIGIAMGKHGSEVSREAADMILLDDNFATIVNTIRDGRRIYDNMRKAIGYVFAIHIPIVLTSLLAPLLRISPASLMLLPIHVVLLELVIDPTCSIVLERQPPELDIMDRQPRDPKEGILTRFVLAKGIIQGLCIFAASFGTYYYMLEHNANPAIARSMGFAILIIANIFLVQVNSSNRENMFFTFEELVRDKILWIVNIAMAGGVLLALYTPLNSIFRLAPLNIELLLIMIGIAAASVLWYEIVKFFIRRRRS